MEPLQIILDPTFSDNDCLKGIYDQLGGSPTFQNYLQNFDGDFSVANLKFSVGLDEDYPTANAVTIGPINYLIEIMFNPNNLNRPSLDVARTFIHEMIHAEIYRKLLSCAGLPNVNFHNYSQQEWENYITNLHNDFPGLFDYYLRYSYNTTTPSDYQHELMAQHYRDIIINTLKEFDNSQSENVYEALAWVGLMGDGDIDPVTGLPTNPTVAWQNTPQNKRLEILETFFNYHNENSDNLCQ